MDGKLPGMDHDEPTFIGKFPIRTELTVLPADPPREPLNFVVHIRNGGEVLTMKDGKLDETALTREEDIWVGRAIVVPTLVGFYEAVACQRNSGEWWWQTPSGGTVGDLVFDADDRHCWTTTFAANARAIKMLDLTGDDE